MALDGVTDVLAAHVKLPPGVTMDQFMASPRCYFDAFRTPGNFYCDGKPAPAMTIDLTTFDRIKFLMEVEKLVIKPLEDTVDLFRVQRFMTRFYTTMSAREMTLDPEFDLNSTLPAVSNAHTLALKYTNACPPSVTGAWEATLASGQTVTGIGTQWPLNVKEQRVPVNRRVLQLSASGAGQVVTDNSAMIGAMMPPTGGGTGGTGATGTGGTAGMGSTGTGGTGGSRTGGTSGSAVTGGSGAVSSSDGGCSVAGQLGNVGRSGSAGGLLLALALTGLALRRRRRKFGTLTGSRAPRWGCGGGPASAPTRWPVSPGW